MRFAFKEKLNKGNTLVYRLFNDDDIPVGYSQIRLTAQKSDEMPEGFESHIYYEIYPDFQHKGFGTKLFNDTITQAHDLGIARITVVCDDLNFPSKKVIESAGGILLEQKKDKNGYIMNKYLFKS